MYVATQQPNPVLLTGEVVIGARVPDVVTLNPVPNQAYGYAHINGQWVLVDTSSRLIIGVI